MRGIKYVSCIHDHSGYGHACRNYILALHRKGIPITIRPRDFEINPPPTANAEEAAILESLIDRRDILYDIVIVHLTPDLYPNYREVGKYNIGFCAWETSLLHPRWVRCCNEMDEMWVPSDYNVQALKNSGVEVPVYKIPHGIDIDMFAEVQDTQFKIKSISETTYKFYSIFQWMERKNPEGLLRAYFNAFDKDDDVALILKTYRVGHKKDTEFFAKAIQEIKRDMNIGHYPRIFVVADLLSNNQMLGLHNYGDCYVSLHRGEGFGLTCFQAGLAGNPVIATGYSGNLEFMNKENSYLVDYQEAYVSNMSRFNSWYLGNQRWADVDLVDASKNMQYVYYNMEEALSKGSLLRESIKSKYSWDLIADTILERLSNI